MRNELIRMVAALGVAGLLAACAPESNEPTAPAPAPAEAPTPAAAPAAAPAPAAEAEPRPATGRCVIDAINGQKAPSITVSKSGEVVFGGWMEDAAGQAPDDARLLLRGATRTYDFPLPAGVSRPDVAAALHNDALANAGYRLVVDLAAVENGTYGLAIAMQDDASLACPLDVELAVED